VLVHRHGRRDRLDKSPNGGITKVTGRTGLSLTIGIRQEGSRKAHRQRPDLLNEFRRNSQLKCVDHGGSTAERLQEPLPPRSAHSAIRDMIRFQLDFRALGR
jgi:hypothetical protein